MNVAVIGAGNMGSAFARRLSASGHEVAITSKGMESARKVAAETGPNVRAVPTNRVAEGADIIIAATPAGEQVNAVRSIGGTAGRVVVDIANPLTSDFLGLTVGHITSFAEELAKQLPGAKVVKAFNTVFAQVLAEGGDFGGRRIQVFFAGDEDEAKEKVRALIESCGFEAVDAGPLQNARYLEPLGGLNIWFGYVAGRGAQILPVWLSRQGPAT